MDKQQFITRGCIARAERGASARGWVEHSCSMGRCSAEGTPALGEEESAHTIAKPFVLFFRIYRHQITLNHPYSPIEYHTPRPNKTIHNISIYKISAERVTNALP